MYETALFTDPPRINIVGEKRERAQSAATGTGRERIKVVTSGTELRVSNQHGKKAA